MPGVGTTVMWCHRVLDAESFPRRLGHLVSHQDDLAAAVEKPGTNGRLVAETLAVTDCTDLGVALGQFVGNFGSGVGGAVVNHDHFGGNRRTYDDHH